MLLWVSRALPKNTFHYELWILSVNNSVRNLTNSKNISSILSLNSLNRVNHKNPPHLYSNTYFVLIMKQFQVFSYFILCSLWLINAVMREKFNKIYEILIDFSPREVSRHQLITATNFGEFFRIEFQRFTYLKPAAHLTILVSCTGDFRRRIFLTLVASHRTSWVVVTWFTWSRGYVVTWSWVHVVTWLRGHVVMSSRGHVA